MVAVLVWVDKFLLDMVSLDTWDIFAELPVVEDSSLEESLE